MAKPPVQVVDILQALPRSDCRRGAFRHFTLMPVGECRTMPRRGNAAAAALESLGATAARVVFDRLHDSGRTLALCGSETMRGICRLQDAIRQHLSCHGIPLPRYRFNPHITLAYRSDGRGSETIDPISWSVEDVLLIESVYGEGRHIEHGRWRLRDPLSIAA